MRYLFFNLVALVTIPTGISGITHQASLGNAGLPQATVVNHGLDTDAVRYIKSIIEHFHVPSMTIAVLNGSDTSFEALHTQELNLITMS